MACYTLTTCGGVNPYYSFESTEPLLAAQVGNTVLLSNITPDSGIGPGMPEGMCWYVEEKGTCSTTYSLNIDSASALCSSCRPGNYMELRSCVAGPANVIVGFIGDTLPVLGNIILFNSIIPTPGCTLDTSICWSVFDITVFPDTPECWTEDWQVVEANCTICEECIDNSITADIDIKEGCKDVFLKITANGWTPGAGLGEVVTTGVFITVDGVKYDISTYIYDVYDPGITLTFDEQFTDGIHCWEVEVINGEYCNYKVDFCELSLCQACCKLKALAAKLLKDCDRCSDEFKEKFLEAYAIYKALQLAGICGNEDAITKGLKTLNALLDELGCKDCKNC